MIIRSPINYVGSKYRLLPQILPLFPKQINCFLDAFGGSGNVLINVEAEHYIYNDINLYITEIFERLIIDNPEETVTKITNLINKYNLSKTNKQGFLALRQDYNSGKKDWITLYTLMCYSFNGQSRFNNLMQYNSAFGTNRGGFSKNQMEEIYKLHEKNRDITFLSQSIFNIDLSDFDENDFIYFDPPYLNSYANYNKKTGFDGWTEEHEKQLLALLDNLTANKVKWALSNHLGYNNNLLEKWREKYHTHYLKCDYSNCNYQRKKDTSEGAEVLITNYLT